MGNAKEKLLNRTETELNARQTESEPPLAPDALDVHHHALGLVQGVAEMDKRAMHWCG